MKNIKKISGFILLGLGVLVSPFAAEAREAEGVDFATHCSLNTTFNNFALITSTPPEGDVPLVGADDGTYVAIYEVTNEPSDEMEINLEVSGEVAADNEYAVICSSQKVIAIVPTYQMDPLDTNRLFKIQYTINIEAPEEGASDDAQSEITVNDDVLYFTDSNTSVVIPNSNDYDWNDENEPFVEIEEMESSDLPSKSTDFKTIVGGYAYHEIYATYAPKENDTEKDAFTLENIDPKNSFKYSIFPPLETISGCSASTLAILTVDDMKCFPKERQVEYKRYFLGLPEAIQLLFDFPSEEENPASLVGTRDFIVNYFNEASDLQADPTTGSKYLSVSYSDKQYRYFKQGELPDDAELQSGLVSHYETCYDGTDLDTACYSTEGCDIDETIETIAEITSPTGDSMVIGQGMCDGGPVLLEDAASLLEHVTITDPNDPKLQNLAEVNAAANAICTDINMSGGINKLQAINASSVAITQYLADLDSRYEGFNACEKISAINTLSGLMERTAELLGHPVSNP